MKKLFFICFLSLFLLNGYSQKTIIGFETLTGFSNNYFDNQATKCKENFGIIITGAFRIKKNCYLQTGIGYELNGYKYNRDFKNHSLSILNPESGDIEIYYIHEFENKIRVLHNYITFPIQLRFSNIGKNQKIKIKSGLYYAYLLSLVYKETGYSIVSYAPEKYDHKRSDWNSKIKQSADLNCRRHDFGLNFDVSYLLFTWGKMNLDIGLYGKLGLLSMYKTNKLFEPYGQNYAFGIKLVLEKGIVF